jgi:hypothetical protein
MGVWEEVDLGSGSWEFVLLVVVAGWSVTLFLVSRVGGWFEISQSYPLKAQFNGERFGWQSASLRYWMSYNASLVVGADGEGLFVSTILPFRFCHPPIFVPWSEVSVAEKKGTFSDKASLTFAQCPTVPLVISKRLMKRVSEASGGVI